MGLRGRISSEQGANTMKVKTHYASMSEAIRAGALLRPQAFGHLFKYAWKENDLEIQSCAIGAAAEAVSGRRANSGGTEAYNFLSRLYPYLRDKCACPEACSESEEVQDIIIHLNDDHLMSRERIADWVEKYEEKIGFVTLVEEKSNVEEKLSEGAGEGSNRDSVVPEPARFASAAAGGK